MWLIFSINLKKKMFVIFPKVDKDWRRYMQGFVLSIIRKFVISIKIVLLNILNKNGLSIWFTIYQVLWNRTTVYILNFYLFKYLQKMYEDFCFYKFLTHPWHNAFFSFKILYRGLNKKRWFLKYELSKDVINCKGTFSKGTFYSNFFYKSQIV